MLGLNYLAHSRPLALGQAHLRSLGAHKRVGVFRAHAHLPDEVADHQCGAAPSARFAVHICELCTLRMLCTCRMHSESVVASTPTQGHANKQISDTISDTIVSHMSEIHFRLYLRRGAIAFAGDYYKAKEGRRTLAAGLPSPAMNATPL